MTDFLAWNGSFCWEKKKWSDSDGHLVTMQDQRDNHQRRRLINIINKFMKRTRTLRKVKSKTNKEIKFVKREERTLPTFTNGHCGLFITNCRSKRESKIK